MDIGVLTHNGRRRPHNEDSYRVREDLGLFIVADGMGGHDGGEVASALAVDIIEREIAAGTPLEQAILAAHAAIAAHPLGQGGVRGMGTTVVVVRFLDEARTQFEAAWVGDSRIYQITRDEQYERLVQISRDHTLVQDLVDRRLITPEQARTHDKRNIITQALGACQSPGPQVESAQAELRPGEVLLLCSDGLNGEIEDSVIQALLGNQVQLVETVCQELVDAALAAGGRDNITVVVLRA